LLERPFETFDSDAQFDAVIGSSILHHLEVEESLEKIFGLLKSDGRLCLAEPNMLNPQIMVQKNVPWIKERLGDSPDETAFIRFSLARLLRRAGFVDIDITPFDWLHPSTPSPMIPVVRALGRVFEKLPVIREFAGSLSIHARRP
jgi:SAM-dependent methyltransferase